ncbi:MAG: hypothetical protein J6Y47_08185 [Bacteroidales bacterium]|nr:hypothetical protein [Bacteroidales bacterium]
MKICCNQLRKDYPVIIEYRLNRTITTGTTAFIRGYFLSPDPFVQDWENSQNFNRYSYCLNNPLKYTDPSGEFFQYILGGIFGGIQGFSKCFEKYIKKLPWLYFSDKYFKY